MLEMGTPLSLFKEMTDAIREENMKPEDALRVVTSNVADILKLKQKGRIREGHDADMVLLDAEYRIVHLVANGSLMIKDGKMLKKGSYER